MTKLVEELRMYASMSNHPDLLIDAADELTALRTKNARLRAEVKKHAIDALLATDGNLMLDEENKRLRAVLDLYREAVQIDVTMEGPKFMGSNSSALKRAWDADRAALETREAGVSSEEK